MLNHFNVSLRERFFWKGSEFYKFLKENFKKSSWFFFFLKAKVSEEEIKHNQVFFSKNSIFGFCFLENPNLKPNDFKSLIQKLRKPPNFYVAIQSCINSFQNTAVCSLCRGE
jgi:hypothetical protein